MRFRLPFLVLGVILFLLGALWSLQGAGLVGGSFMVGQRQWLVIGIVVAAAGLGLGCLGLFRRAQRT